MTKLQVFEYQSIAYQGRYETAGFEDRHFEAFERYYNENERTPYFELISKGVRFKSHVGVIQIGDLIIEVLPKADKQNANSNANQWQGILLEMLKTCRLLTASKSSDASLKLKANSILKLYFELFLVELENLIQKGLIKKYRQHQSQQKALKGALVFSEQIKHNLVHKERFYVRHTQYDKKHRIHQILHEALLVLQDFDHEGAFRDRIGRILLNFPQVERLRIQASVFDQIPRDRKHAPYQDALSIAKLLLLNYRPDIQGGKEDLIALMFDMNKLWEEYIFRTLKKELHEEWEVSGQEQQYFWENKVIKPDIVLRHRSDNRIYIIDTKWKIPEEKKPSDNDLKQMFAYNHYWDCTHSLLLYPHAGQHDYHGSYSKELRIGEEFVPHHCSMGFFDLVDYLENEGHGPGITVMNMLKTEKLLHEN